MGKKELVIKCGFHMQNESLNQLQGQDNKKITLLVVYYYCLALPKWKPVIAIICYSYYLPL